MKFLFPEAALCLYKFTVRCYVECCCQAWLLGTSCYLDMFDKLQKSVCMTVITSLAATLEPLAHRQNVVSSSPFFKHYFGMCLSELGELVWFPYSRGKVKHVILIGCMISLSPYLDGL